MVIVQCRSRQMFDSPSIQTIFKAAGVSVTVKETQRAGHATEMVQSLQLDRCDALITVGGDGTVFEALQVMPFCASASLTPRFTCLSNLYLRSAQLYLISIVQSACNPEHTTYTLICTQCLLCPVAPATMHISTQLCRSAYRSMEPCASAEAAFILLWVRNAGQAELPVTFLSSHTQFEAWVLVLTWNAFQAEVT